jgi:hypothetical protein
MATSFIGGGNLECLEKTTDLSQVTDKLYYIMFYLTLIREKYIVEAFLN